MFNSIHNISLEQCLAEKRNICRNAKKLPNIFSGKRSSVCKVRNIIAKLRSYAFPISHEEVGRYTNHFIDSMKYPRWNWNKIDAPIAKLREAFLKYVLNSRRLWMDNVKYFTF